MKISRLTVFLLVYLAEKEKVKCLALIQASIAVAEALALISESANQKIKLVLQNMLGLESDLKKMISKKHGLESEF